MPIDLKTHTPISARSPFFINCEPATGTILSVELVVTIQLGTRQDAAISMTDVATYTINKSDAVNNKIVIDISPLIRDYFVHQFIEFASASYVASNTGQVYFVLIEKTITNSSTTESTVETYYTIKDGFSYFKDGVNFIPSTGATGNYPFTEPIAYDTDVTIMATNCYRQMGQDSYAIIGINTGEFDRKHSDSRSWMRAKFGPGEDWKTDKTETTNLISNQFAAVSDSATRLDTINQSVVYCPIGKKNRSSNWFDGFDFLRVGHFVYSDDIGGNAAQELVTVPEESDFGWDDGVFQFSLSVWVSGTPLITVGDQYSMTLPAFTGCGTTWTEETDTVEVVAWDGDFISVIALDAGFSAHMECVATTFPATSYQLKILINVVQASDAIASINDQPILRYEILCEPKYNVIDCVFINKFGCWDSFSFLKKSVQKFNTTSSNYKRSIGEVGASGFSYSLTDHQKVQYNKNGYKSITVNTGFVDESFNLLLEEMMLSEKMYLIIDDVVEPVNLNTSSVELKASVNDKLINYTMDFDFAYDNLNNIV
jgi:hypothetical protein